MQKLIKGQNGQKINNCKKQTIKKDNVIAVHFANFSPARKTLNCVNISKLN